MTLLIRVVHELGSEHGDIGSRGTRSTRGRHVGRQEDKVGHLGLGNLNDLLLLVSEGVLNGLGQILSLLILSSILRELNILSSGSSGTTSAALTDNANDQGDNDEDSKANETIDGQAREDEASDHENNVAVTSGAVRFLSFFSLLLSLVGESRLRLATEDGLADIIS